MKAILLNSMIALFFLVGCSHAQPNKNADAKTLTDQAERKAREYNPGDNNRSEIYRSALNLLNQAIKKDPRYWPAYEEKILYQTTLKQLDSAAVTAKQLVILKPQDDFVFYHAGEALERVGDTTTAWDYYKKALVLNNNQLDTMKVTSEKFRLEKRNRAMILRLLNQPEKAHDILQQLYDTEKDDRLKEFYRRDLELNRHDEIFGISFSSFIKKVDKGKEHKPN